jgi:hypothetical protein
VGCSLLKPFDSFYPPNSHISHNMANSDISLSWSAVFKVAHYNKLLPGDKIILPQSALEQLLAASKTAVATPRVNAPAFDPFNPYSLAAARAEAAEWRDSQQQLPYPLTFRLVNSKNGNVVHAGIREFSAEEGEVGLSPFLLEALGVTAPPPKSTPASTHSNDTSSPSAPIDLTDDDDTAMDLSKNDDQDLAHITVHAKQLPKGTYVRLRPLEAGYNPEDWKAILERHLRENYTTLTNGEILTVRGSKAEEYRFLIDRFSPEGDGICVVDTDLEVDIEALNEEQARETVKQIISKAQKAPGTAEGSSVGGDLNMWKPSVGQVLSGDYVDYQLPSWDRSQGIKIELEDAEGLELFVSPFSPYQRSRPRDDEHVFGDFSNDLTKQIYITASNIELEKAESLYVSVYARPPPDESLYKLRKFSLRYTSVPKDGTSEMPIVLETEHDEVHSPDEEECKNCTQWIPKRTMMLHENFCLRNNIICPHCKNVFQKKSEEWANHWHCPNDSAYGNTLSSKTIHDATTHTARECPNCPYEATNLRDLASHRTSICPGKHILCQFCHLEVPQEGDPFDPSADQLISGLTAHELADGARTTNCHLCLKIIRLRDMATHLKHHELEKTTRTKPDICRNQYCGRTLHGVGKNGEIGAGSRMGQGPGNDLGLCSICFGPLYVSMHDPEGKAMRRRVERRYLSQLMTGCGKSWCKNEYCKTARSKSGKPVSMTAQEALPKVKPLMDMLPNKSLPMHFCVDDASQKRRGLAEMLAAEKGYDLEWCVAAVEAETGNLDRARSWLQNWAPGR